MDKPSLRLVLTNEFGDSIDIKCDLASAGIEDVYEALRCMLMGCGYHPDTIKEYFES